MGWGGVFLGAYLLTLWIVETYSNRVSTDLFTYIGTVVVGLIFLAFGMLGISMAKNLENRVRVVAFSNDLVYIEFWWRGRRKDIEFVADDIESVEPCQKEKGIIELLAKLPREPICYQVCVRGQAPFILTGSQDDVHEVAKRLAGTNEHAA